MTTSQRRREYVLLLGLDRVGNSKCLSQLAVHQGPFLLQLCEMSKHCYATLCRKTTQQSRITASDGNTKTDSFQGLQKTPVPRYSHDLMMPASAFCRTTPVSFNLPSSFRLSPSLVSCTPGGCPYTGWMLPRWRGSLYWGRSGDCGWIRWVCLHKGTVM